MATIVTRAGKGSPLTHTEMDSNFTNLNTAKTELTDLASTASGKGAAMVGRAAAVVSSIAALRALLKTSAGQHAFVTGYYAQGDGGGGAYWYDSTDTTSADNGGSIIVAADGGRWKLVFSSFVSVKQFGAKGDTTTDDTTAIQATHTAHPLVSYPAGTFKVSAAITITQNNASIRGVGNSSKIVTSHATADIFTLGDGVAAFIGFTCSDLAIESSVSKTAGWAFNARFIARALFHNVFIGLPEDTVNPPRLYGGIYFDRFDYCTVFGGHIITNTRGIACRGNADQSFGAGLFLDGGLKIACSLVVGSVGVEIGGAAGGVYFDSVDLIVCGDCVVINTLLQSGIPNREVFFGGTCSLDGPGVSNLTVAANSLTHLDITGTWIASSGTTNSDGVGVVLSSPNPNLVVQLSGPRFFNNRGGAFVANAGDISWSGGTVYSNGTGGAGHDAIWLPNTNVTGFRMSGVKVDNNGTAGVGYGLKIAAGAPSQVLNVCGNTFVSNAQGAVSYPDAFTASKKMSDNVGFVTEAIGSATVTNGNSLVSVNHGIDPSRSTRVLLTPIGNFPESGQYWSSVPTTTAFDLNLGVAATRNNDFIWKAEAL